MRRYVSRLLILVIAVTLCFGAMMLPASAESMDLQKECSLQMIYANDGVNYEGLPVQIYRVASAQDGYTFKLEAPFHRYRVNINDVQSQEEWRSIATTLSSYAIADGLTPTATGTTNADGTVEFQNLRPGIYLTMGIREQVGKAFVSFESFLTAIPYPSNDGESYLYDLTIYPKGRVVTPKEGMVLYKVVKQWKDEGHRKYRANKVTVEIFRNGESYETVTLSAKNNWTYSWRAEDDGSQWIVVERNVPKGYFVTVSENETTYIVTNTADEDYNPPSPGHTQTGDTANLGLYVAVMCLSGIVILLVAFKMKKSES